MDVFPHTREHSETEGPSLLQGFAVLAIRTTTTSPTPCMAPERTSASPYIFPSPGKTRTMQGLPRFSTSLSYVPPLLRREMNEIHVPIIGIPFQQPSPIGRVARHLHFPDRSGRPSRRYIRVPHRTARTLRSSSKNLCRVASCERVTPLPCTPRYMAEQVIAMVGLSPTRKVAFVAHRPSCQS